MEFRFFRRAKPASNIALFLSNEHLVFPASSSILNKVRCRQELAMQDSGDSLQTLDRLEYV